MAKWLPLHPRRRRRLPAALWFRALTRLAPDPLSQDPKRPGGLQGSSIDVAYEIADDPGLTTIIRKGIVPAEADYAFSVHLEVQGLQPGRPYWYRFHSGDASSRVGKAWTAPDANSPLERLRLGFVSCSNYELGYFSAYRHLADEAPDIVLFLGDYIYEYVSRSDRAVRKHSDGVEAATLPTYRNRYAQYHTDPDLQRLRSEVTSLITWDDHEVQNDYADSWSQTFDDPERFLHRRAAAYHAFYEHMPLSPRLSRPQGASMRIFNRFDFGKLAQICMLDGRQRPPAPNC